MTFMDSFEMWSIGLGTASIIALAIFLLNQHLARRASRIGGVVSEYIRIFESEQWKNGLHALSRAGILNLKTDLRLMRCVKK